ncbi:hypothetical protein [Actinocorallia herbida]|nr:hypothetical protein [Actinocorallia herbida]
MKIVDEGVANAVAGPELRSFTVGGATVLTGSEGLVIIAGIGDDLAASGVRSHRRFELKGEVPAGFDQVLEDKLHDFPHHLFVRTPDGLLSAGSGRCRRSGWSGDPSVFRSADITLDEPLSWEALDLVRPPVPPAALPGIAWLDHVADDRPRALREFVDGWYRRTPDASIPPEVVGAGIPVPRALQEFYALARGHVSVMGRQNFLRSPAELEVDAAGRLHFGDENQGCFVWALASGQDTDPRVLISEDREVWHEEGEPLSGFLLQFALYEAFADAPYRAWPKAILTRRQALQMIDGWRHVPLSPFLRSRCPATFAVSPGLVAQFDFGEADDDECVVSVVATDRSVLRPLRALDLDWSEYDG